MSFNQQPTDINFLQPSSHRFVINRMPATTFFVQSIKIPDVILPPVMEGNPFVALNYAGDHVTFTPLLLEFKVDEDFLNYREIFNWMVGLGFPQEFSQYAEVKRNSAGNAGIRSDASLIIVDSAQVPNKEFYFRDIFPTRISGPKFDTRNTEVNYVTTEVEFSIRDFDVNNLVP